MARCSIGRIDVGSRDTVFIGRHTNSGSLLGIPCGQDLFPYILISEAVYPTTPFKPIKHASVTRLRPSHAHGLLKQYPNSLNRRTTHQSPPSPSATINPSLCGEFPSPPFAATNRPKMTYRVPKTHLAAPRSGK